MVLIIKDAEADAAARDLARLRGKTLTETVRDALKNELQKARDEIPLAKRLDAIAEEFAKYPKTGLKADKAWFDEMWGEKD
jgi:antitoxin VapB